MSDAELPSAEPSDAGHSEPAAGGPAGSVPVPVPEENPAPATSPVSEPATAPSTESATAPAEDDQDSAVPPLLALETPTREAATSTETAPPPALSGESTGTPEPAPVTADDLKADDTAEVAPAEDDGEAGITSASTTAPASESATEVATEPALSGSAASEPAPAESAKAADPAPTAPRPGPGVAPRPGPAIAPRPGPAFVRPPARRPAVVEAPAEPAAEPLPETSPYGRVDAEGTVYLTTADGERAIGSWQGGDAAAGIAYYTRRYDDLMTRSRLVRDRLAAGSMPAEQAGKAVAEIRESLPTADVLGDLGAVEAVLAEVDGLLAKRRAERAQARTAATAVRRRLVEEAEKLVDSTSWNASGDRFKAIVEEWTAAGHGDRRDEDALWKRLSAARAAFGEKRRSAFLERDRERDAARQRKEQLIREAEALSSSSEWTDTARKYRDLMDRWKAAGRAPKAEDDALWNRFRTAQDAFFARRAETFSARDAEFAGNQKAKEALLERAERIDPRSDLAGAQALLRSIQADWEAVGKVPREAITSLEARLEAVEDRVREASDARWQRPAAQESGLIGQLRRTVSELEDKLARAQARGDVKAAKAAETELTTKRSFLQMAEQAR